MATAMRSHLPAALLALVLAAAPAAAQDGSAKGSGKLDLSNAKLRNFAEAVVQVQEVIAEHKPAIAKAKETGKTERRQELQKQLQTAVKVKISEVEGVSLAEFRKINRRAREDAALRKRIGKIVRKLQGEG
jgi:hypothetical protein